MVGGSLLGVGSKGKAHNWQLCDRMGLMGLMTLMGPLEYGVVTRKRPTANRNQVSDRIGLASEARSTALSPPRPAICLEQFENVPAWSRLHRRLTLRGRGPR